MLKAQAKRKARESNKRSVKSLLHLPSKPKSRISKVCREDIMALVSSLSCGKCCTQSMDSRFSPILPRLSGWRAHECLWEGWQGMVGAVDSLGSKLN